MISTLVHCSTNWIRLRATVMTRFQLVQNPLQKVHSLPCTLLRWILDRVKWPTMLAGGMISNVSTQHGMMNAITEAGMEPRMEDTIGDAGTEPGKEDVIISMNMKPGAGDVIGGEGSEPGAISTADMKPGMESGDTGIKPAMAVKIRDSSTEPEIGDMTSSTGTQPGIVPGDVISDAASEPRFP